MTLRRGGPVLVVAAALVVAGGVGAAGASSPGVARAVVKAAAAPSVLYVKPCTATTGDGSWADPFCTLAAAEAAVQPGQTVMVEPGDYPEALKITRSGTAGAPITFQADNHYQQPVTVNRYAGVTNVPVLTISGVHDVVVRGFDFAGTGSAQAAADGLQVSGSSDVTLDQDQVLLTRGLAAVHVSGTNSGITLTRLTTRSNGGTAPSPGIQVDPGTTGLVVSGNDVLSAFGPIAVSGAPGAEVVGNTVLSYCSTGIAIGTGSAAAVVENNVVEPSYFSAPNTPQACPADRTTAPAVSVAAGSTSKTVADYNLVDPTAGTPLYSWAGTTYPTLAAFRAASGQGAHDIVADPQLQNAPGVGAPVYHSPAATSPALDSADANAPGELPSDLFANGRADDPDVANTGTGIGYADRGAVEDVGPVHLTGDGELKHVPGGGPLDSEVTSSLTSDWTHTGPVGWTDATYSDGAHEITRATTVTHSFARAGQQCVERLMASTDGFRGDAGTGFLNACQVFGADYTPVAPVRILNTRSRIGVGTTTPVAAGATVTVPLTSINAVPMAQISAVAVSLTDTSPTVAGGVSVYAAGAADPGLNDVNFAVGETRSGLVTVPTSSTTTGLTVHNASKGTVHVILDVEGYYGATGSGYEPLTPVRVLHTTTGLGAGGVKAPLAAGASLTESLTSWIPSTATAAVLNVTATSHGAAGGLTVYPAGQTRPTPYDVDFGAGATVTTLVTARVSGGKVTFYNASSGPVDLAADLQGFYGPASSGAVNSYVPYGPVRLGDSGSTPVAAKGAAGFDPAFIDDGCVPFCAVPTSDLATVTAVGPKAPGDLIAYPTGATRPTIPTVSFGTGQTVTNASTVSLAGQLKVYVDSTGSARILVDLQGYFIAAS